MVFEGLACLVLFFFEAKNGHILDPVVGENLSGQLLLLIEAKSADLLLPPPEGVLLPEANPEEVLVSLLVLRI